MKKWKFILQLFITIIILWYLAYKIPLQQVYQALLDSKPTWFVTALGFILLSLFSMSVRMKLMMRQQKITISLWDVFRIRLISFYYKLFIPGGTLANIGILFYKFSQIRKEQKPEIISSIMFDRILATIGLCAIGLICLFFSKPDLPPLLIYFLALIFFSLLAMVALASNITVSNSIENYLSNSENRFAIKFIEFLHSVNEFRNLSKLDLLYINTLSLLPHIFGIFAFYAISLSLGLELSLLDWGWIRSVVIIGTMLPISLAGIGIRDGILIYLLHQYAAPADTAWAISFLLLAATTLWPAVLGLILGFKRIETS